MPDTDESLARVRALLDRLPDATGLMVDVDVLRVLIAAASASAEHTPQPVGWAVATPGLARPSLGPLLDTEQEARDRAHGIDGPALPVVVLPLDTPAGAW